MEDDILKADIDPSPPPTSGKLKSRRSFDWGLQPYKFLFKNELESTKQETLIFVMPSTVSHSDFFLGNGC